jgi:hypothetical protein
MPPNPANGSAGSSRSAARADRVGGNRAKRIPAGGHGVRDCLTLYDDYGKVVNPIAWSHASRRADHKLFFEFARDRL